MLCKQNALVRSYYQKVSNAQHLPTEHWGFIANKIIVVKHLAEELETLIILLQETHCTIPVRQVIRNYKLAVSSLSRTYGVATFVHERPNWILCSQSQLHRTLNGSACLLMGTKLSTPTSFPQHNSVFPHPSLSVGNFNFSHSDWGYNTNSADKKFLAA